jgi:hypothetical protein
MDPSTRRARAGLAGVVRPAGAAVSIGPSPAFPPIRLQNRRISRPATSPPRRICATHLTHRVRVEALVEPLDDGARRWVRFVTRDARPMAHFPVSEAPMRFCAGFEWVRLGLFSPPPRGRDRGGPPPVNPSGQIFFGGTVWDILGRDTLGRLPKSRPRRVVKTLGQNRAFSGISGHRPPPRRARGQTRTRLYPCRARCATRLTIAQRARGGARISEENRGKKFCGSGFCSRTALRAFDVLRVPRMRSGNSLSHAWKLNG